MLKSGVTIESYNTTIIIPLIRHLIIIIVIIKSAMFAGLEILIVPSGPMVIIELRYMPISWVIAERMKAGMKIDLNFILNKSFDLKIVDTNRGGVFLSSLLFMFW